MDEQQLSKFLPDDATLVASRCDGKTGVFQVWYQLAENAVVHTMKFVKNHGHWTLRSDLIAGQRFEKIDLRQSARRDIILFQCERKRSEQRFKKIYLRDSSQSDIIYVQCERNGNKQQRLARNVLDWPIKAHVADLRILTALCVRFRGLLSRSNSS